MQLQSIHVFCYLCVPRLKSRIFEIFLVLISKVRLCEFSLDPVIRKICSRKNLLQKLVPKKWKAWMSQLFDQRSRHRFHQSISSIPLGLIYRGKTFQSEDDVWGYTKSTLKKLFIEKAVAFMFAIYRKYLYSISNQSRSLGFISSIDSTLLKPLQES